jgi:hypothetical protein
VPARSHYRDCLLRFAKYSIDLDDGILFAYSKQDLVGYGQRDTCKELLYELASYRFAWDLISL